MNNIIKRREYEKQKYYCNAKYIINRKIRTYYKDIIRKNIKYSKYELILGYSIDIFKREIESKFKDGMSWDNYGKWEIDHIIPLTYFHYTSMNEQAFRNAWSFLNIRPLWKKENMKRKKYLC